MRPRREAPAPTPEPKVGYCQPPMATRFQAGRSGNPKGRPKGAANIATIVREELERTTRVLVGGKYQRMTNGQVMVRRLMEQGFKGEFKAIVTLMKLAGQNSEAAQPSPENASELSTAQCESILADWVDGLKGGK